MVLQRCRTNRMGVNICLSIYHLSIYLSSIIYLKIIYLKELAHTIMEMGNFKIFRMSQEAGDRGRTEVVVQVLRRSASGIPSCLEKFSLLFRSSTD